MIVKKPPQKQINNPMMKVEGHNLQKNMKNMNFHPQNLISYDDFESLHFPFLSFFPSSFSYPCAADASGSRIFSGSRILFRVPNLLVGPRNFLSGPKTFNGVPKSWDVAAYLAFSLFLLGLSGAHESATAPVTSEQNTAN